MALIGTGYQPSGALGTEFSNLIRRAFIPKVVSQIYTATPTLQVFMGSAQRAKGGIASITVPVQVAQSITANWSDFVGSFTNPSDLVATTNGEMNLSVALAPIPFIGMEALITASETVVPRLKIKMADAKQALVRLISRALFTGNTATNIMSGFPQAYDDGTNFSTYANVSRTTYPSFKSTLLPAAGAVLTRANFIKFIVQTSVGGHSSTIDPGSGEGEAPDLVIMNPSDWTTLSQDFLGLERYQIDPSSQFGKDDIINSGFRALQLVNTNIVADIFCPKGVAFLINTKYFAIYLHEEAAFSFSGFFSNIPNGQIANVGVVIVVIATLCTKPISGMQVTGVTGGAF